MSTVTFLHCADIHLDSKLLGLERYEGAPVDELRSASRKALAELTLVAINEGVDLVLIAGDVFDGDWKDYNTGLFFSKQMSLLRDAGIPVVMIAGNHDAESQISRSLRYPDNVRVLSTDKPATEYFPNIGIAVHGQGFRTREVLDDLSAAYPKPEGGFVNVGMLHTSADGREGHDSYAPCDPRVLAQRGYDYWALGHVHKRETLLRVPEHPCWAVFPGNLQGRHARETGDKGFSIVRVEDGQVLAPVHHACDVVRWAECRVDATGIPDGESLLAAVHLALLAVQDGAGGRLVAARVTIHGRSRARAAIERDREGFVTEVRNLANHLSGAGLWVEKVRIELKGDHDVASLRTKDEPIGDLLRALDELPSTLLEVLNEDLRPIAAQLPREVLERLEGFGAEEWIRRLTPDVQELLVSKVLD
ncbi:metallophosphoesterase family protein [Fimbriimonas ginsengisoli]|uniref:Ser/Thr protein phosphatase family protein n=1 Tax=Fimbriimonas ginsengisoli Gsoil 348 TaxID=661478 RepID=A0A068NRN0_FIMGI|nr:DNA repair exonuclease [Fimbriimonas ginsengisoli]AIE85425.1 Ser/Thr protein phosphatase family protein [Fimbriimonas ginsengisoli Gsoil 348]